MGEGWLLEEKPGAVIRRGMDAEMFTASHAIHLGLVGVHVLIWAMGLESLYF